MPVFLPYPWSILGRPIYLHNPTCKHLLMIKTKKTSTSCLWSLRLWAGWSRGTGSWAWGSGPRWWGTGWSWPGGECSCYLLLLVPYLLLLLQVLLFPFCLALVQLLQGTWSKVQKLPIHKDTQGYKDTTSDKSDGLQITIPENQILKSPLPFHNHSYTPLQTFNCILQWLHIF